MTHGLSFPRFIGGFMSTPRKRLSAFFLLVVIIFLAVMYSDMGTDMPREDKMEQSIAEMQIHLQFLDSLYRARQEELIALQNKVLTIRGNNTYNQLPATYHEIAAPSISPELILALKNYNGTKTAQGIQPRNLQLLRTPFVFQLLPHLMNNANSLRPFYHMKSGRGFVDVVVGIPTVRRDKESYLLITLTHLINGLTDADINSTLIVVFVGETDLEYVLNIARQIETTFPKQVECGLLEILSPSQSYYPDFNTIDKSLGDSMKRVKWRTKQNLDAIYLLSYAQTKGTFYLMLEDDVIAKNNYMQDIKKFTALITVSTPNWFFIEFCHLGGIGKLFRSSDLIHFITYVQLFYKNMPIDWLLESYLADRVCTIDKTSVCSKNKNAIRPKYKISLFQHIGLYSSLKGKIQKVKDTHYGPAPTFFPHDNPPLEFLRTDIVEQGDHTLKRAYEGQTYFWGFKPKKNDLMEFWFDRPTSIRSFLFRSANADHTSDRFYNTVVEVVPAGTNNYTVVGSFDEFGLAEGVLSKDAGPFACIRLRVMSNSFYWVILSEIDIKTYDQVYSK